MQGGFRKKGLFSKMFLTYIVIIAVSFVLTATVLSLWFQGYYLEQRKAQLKSESQFIMAAARQYLNQEISVERVNNILNQIGQYINTDIFVTDNYGYLYAVSNTKYEGMIGKQIITKDLEILRFGNDVDVQGNYDGKFKEKVHTFIIPIKDGGIFKGAIMMNTSINEINGPLKKVYVIIWLSVMFAIITSCIVIYYFSQRIIIKPLAQINMVSEKISKGEVDRRVQISSNDEIGELAKSFNYMADSLEAVDKNRRDFISNVSHEIRSPITSIKGFIGGILDGVIPEEKQKYYLALTFDEIQRLTRLVNDLLDLSAMESGQMKFKLEHIDINEVLRLSVLKFETKIKAKKLNVDVCFEGDSLLVLADKDRVIQVVTNLLDNAIKYVCEAGDMKIYTRKKGEKVLISIFNNGPSIPNEDIKHIWDRFYKVDKSRTSKVSSGLGLSIVTNILSQLGEDVWVENKEGGGVTFTFSLKRA